MKLKIAGSGFVLLAFIVLSSYTLLNTDEDKNEILMKLQLQVLDYNHYQPQVLNNNFSEEVFDLYLERLDYGKRYFVQADIDELKTYRHALDDEAREGTFDFFERSAELYFQRVAEAEAYYKEILAQPFDFAKREELNTDFDQQPYASTSKELREVWRKLLKYQTLIRLSNMMERQEEAAEDETHAGDPERSPKSFEQLEADAREKVREVYERTFSRLLKNRKSDLRSIYINAITNRFDPHTAYFPPRDKEEFDIRMSGQYSGIGASLTDKNGEITVADIIVGSPCYRQGKLEVEDVILKVGQAREEPVDVVDMRVDDAVKLIRGKKGTEVRLTVRKLDGSVEVIPIVRDVVELEATYAKSAILEQENSEEKIGYIYLPKFYVNFEDRNARHCSEDVAKEIEKLKAENVSGIVLDLRNNGGGSLPDVIDMTGLFIEKGPVVQVKSREDEPSVMADEDKRVQYDGPLVVMVNSLSASASEILAAAIQDYQRGIVIGAPTFGKGTVQQMISLDRFIRSGSGIKPLGSLKLTVQKFYRINGGATQLKGVTPDILLPDNYHYIEYGEKEQDYAMPWDEIKSVDYQTWEHTGTPFPEVVANSQGRVAQSETFRLIDERARMLREQQDDETYPLQFEAYEADKTIREEASQKYKSISSEIAGFGASTLSADLAVINGNEETAKNREAWLKNIRKDPYIYEAMLVAKDLQ